MLMWHFEICLEAKGKTTTNFKQIIFRMCVSTYVKSVSLLQSPSISDFGIEICKQKCVSCVILLVIGRNNLGASVENGMCLSFKVSYLWIRVFWDIALCCFRLIVLDLPSRASSQGKVVKIRRDSHLGGGCQGRGNFVV